METKTKLKIGGGLVLAGTIIAGAIIGGRKAKAFIAKDMEATESETFGEYLLKKLGFGSDSEDYLPEDDGEFGESIGEESECGDA